MQQLCLFKEQNEIKLNRWNIYFKAQKLEENKYIAVLNIPSWKFLTRYTIYSNKIESFEIIDYIWYMYISVSIIKNIKNLIDTIIKH